MLPVPGQRQIKVKAPQHPASPAPYPVNGSQETACFWELPDSSTAFRTVEQCNHKFATCVRSRGESCSGSLAPPQAGASSCRDARKSWRHCKSCCRRPTRSLGSGFGPLSLPQTSCEISHRAPLKLQIFEQQEHSCLKGFSDPSRKSHCGQKDHDNWTRDRGCALHGRHRCEVIGSPVF